MIVGGVYSFNGGREVVEAQYPDELAEIYAAVESVNALEHKTKVSKEKTMRGKRLFSPVELNKAFKQEFDDRGWVCKKKVYGNYSNKFYTNDYTPPIPFRHSLSREIDFLKNKLGLEIQFGKYSFMAYDVCAKMPIFHSKGLIDAGVEIVPLKQLASEMSTGVSYFEQLVWDLNHLNGGIPVLILGIGAG